MSAGLAFAGMLVIALLHQQEEKPFECSVCAEIDPYRDEPACTQCAAHHDWMQRAERNEKALAREIRRQGGERALSVQNKEFLHKTIDSQTRAIEMWERKEKVRKVAYVGWGAFTASMVWALFLFL